MATKLKKMELNSVDMVRRGANQRADIRLFKSAGAQEEPTEQEGNLFKRFLGWLRENPAEPQDEPDEGIEKADDQPELEYVYKSAITESLQSIVADESLTEDEKNSLIEKSIDQYHERMAELFMAKAAAEEDPEDEDYLPEEEDEPEPEEEEYEEEVDKSDRFVEIEEWFP